MSDYEFFYIHWSPPIQKTTGLWNWHAAIPESERDFATEQHDGMYPSLQYRIKQFHCSKQTQFIEGYKRWVAQWMGEGKQYQ